MINAVVLSPSKAVLNFPSELRSQIEKLASYKNTAIQFQYKRHLKNASWRRRDEPSWKAHGEALKAKIDQSVLFFENGCICTRPGFLPYLQDHLPVTVYNKIEYPKAKPYPWYRVPTLKPYDYQKLSVEKLIEEKHGNVELATGTGKSFILQMITQKLGLKTLIVTPSVSIFTEMVDAFEYYFGKSSIGVLGNSKKRLGKNIIICVSDSVSNLKPGTKEYNEISKFQVVLADESHTIPSATLEKMCHGVLKDIPYRFFLSGTQTRGDGTTTLLKAIIGKTVHSLGTEEAIKGGFICDHEFRIVKVPSSNPLVISSDALTMKRAHFLKNKNIANFVAMLANTSAETKKESTLVLTDEIDQIIQLLPLLRVSYAIAIGTTDQAGLMERFIPSSTIAALKRSKNLKKIPKEILEPLLTEEAKDIIKNLLANEPNEAVEKFNRGEVKVLLGTSCISTGTNIFPTHHTVNWQGGTSEVKTKQGAVGRSVRKLTGSKFEQFHPPKLKTIIWDFDVENIDVMARHLKARIGFYKQSGVDIKFL